MKVLATDKNASPAINSKYDATSWATHPSVGIAKLFKVVMSSFSGRFRDTSKLPGWGMGGNVTGFVRMVTIFGKDLKDAMPNSLVWIEPQRHEGHEDCLGWEKCLTP